MTNKKIAAGIAAVCLPLMMVAISIPAASAETGVASTVEAKDRCEWGMAGAPANLSLDSADKYEGEELVVSDTFGDLTIGVSGAIDENNGTTGTSTECSFYNDPQPGYARFSLGSTTTFDATYGSGIEDSAMDFTLTEGLGLDIAANLDACPATFSKTDADFRLADQSADVFFMSTMANLYGTGEGPRCAPNITVSTTIPASVDAPAGAGQTYSFTGPTLTISLMSFAVAP